MVTNPGNHEKFTKEEAGDYAEAVPGIFAPLYPVLAKLIIDRFKALPIPRLLSLPDKLHQEITQKHLKRYIPVINSIYNHCCLLYIYRSAYDRTD